MYKIYQIEYGDTIESIADKVGSTPDEILKINGFFDYPDLIVGNLIIVPKKDDSYFVYYKVKPGESIYSIAKEFDVDFDTIMLINGLNKDDYIYPNQEIMIPTKDYRVYVTKRGDSINSVLSNLNIAIEDLMNDNDKILLMEDQLIVSKKR